MPAKQSKKIYQPLQLVYLTNEDLNIMRPRLENFFSNNISPEILVNFTKHGDVRYKYNKIQSHMLIKYFDHNLITKFCKMYSDTRGLISIDMLILFFAQEIHDKDGVFGCNHGDNTVGKYGRYIPVVNALFNVPIVNYLADYDAIDNRYKPFISPARTEFLIVNSLYNLVDTDSLLSKYKKYLPVDYQEMIGTEHKYDSTVGKYITCEVNEPISSHRSSDNDLTKEDNAIINKRIHHTFNVSEFISRKYEYYDKFISSVRESIIESLICDNSLPDDVSSKFRNEYSLHLFVKFLQEKNTELTKKVNSYPEILSDEARLIKEFEEDEIIDNNNIIDSLEDSNDTQTIINKLFEYNRICYQNNKNKLSCDIIPLEFVLTLFTSKDELLYKSIVRYGYYDMKSMKVFFSWEKLITLINNINLIDVESLKRTNFKYLLMVQKINEYYFDLLHSKKSMDVKLLEEKYEKIFAHITARSYHQNFIQEEKHKTEKSNLKEQITFLEKEYQLKVKSLETEVQSLKEKMHLLKTDIINKDVIDNMINLGKKYQAHIDNMMTNKKEYALSKFKNLFENILVIYETFDYDKSDILSSFNLIIDKPLYSKSLVNILQNIKNDLEWTISSIYDEFIDDRMKVFDELETKIISKPVISKKNDTYTINSNEVGKSVIVEIPDLEIVVGERRDFITGNQMKAIFDKNNIPFEIMKRIHLNSIGMFRESSYWSFPEKVYGYCLRSNNKQESLIKEDHVKVILILQEEFPDIGDEDSDIE